MNGAPGKTACSNAGEPGQDTGQSGQATGQSGQTQGLSAGTSPARRPAPLRILIFIHSLRGGGAERVAADLSAHWAQAGRDVMVVTQERADKDAYRLHPCVRRTVLDTAEGGGGWRGMRANLRRVRALRRQIAEFRPHVVLGIMTTASVLAVLAARGMRCKVIVTEHAHPPSQILPAMWRRLRRWAYPRAARVVALTEGTARWLRVHVPGSRVAVVPNAVIWPPATQGPMLVPPDLPERRCLLAVGRLHRDKGFDLLLAAFARIAHKHPDWDLVLLGEGVERERLLAQVRAAGLAARVSLPGRAGNVADWYASADLFALSSRFEGFSNTLVEAMAGGLPVVAFDCDTGPREIVREGVDGVLVRPSGHVPALALALSRLMADENARRTLARHATEVRKRFSAERVLARWQTLFDDILGAGAGHRHAHRPGE
jgi:glycosyltransferase involved in cell wall biosynthesis